MALGLNGVSIGAFREPADTLSYLGLAQHAGLCWGGPLTSLAIRGNYMEPYNEINKTSTLGVDPEEGSTAKNRLRIVFRANSLIEIENLTADEVAKIHLAGASRRRLFSLVKGGVEYVKAKKMIILENFLKSSTKSRVVGERQWIKPSQLTTSGSNAQDKRPRSEDNTAQKNAPKRLRPTPQETSCKGSLTPVEVAVVENGFPNVQMDSMMLEALEEAIMLAYEKVPEEGPPMLEVKFNRCTHKPGYLVISCADKVSTNWLIDIVPTLRPWKGAFFQTLVGDEIPKPLACTAYIPDSRGIRLTAERILARLKAANRQLNTHLWIVSDEIRQDKGSEWTFFMDQESYEALQNVDMQPHLGMGRILFRRKGKEEGSNNLINPHGSTSERSFWSRESVGRKLYQSAQKDTDRRAYIRGGYPQGGPSSYLSYHQ